MSRAIVRRADPVERLADHFLRLVAENRHCARIPDRDQAVLVGAHQAIAERHGDPLEAPFGDAAQQAAEVDLVERHGGEIGGDGDMPERGIEDDGELGLQQHGARSAATARPTRTTTRTLADRRRHSTTISSAIKPSPPSVSDAGRGAQHAALQDRFRGQHLQLRARNDAAVRHAEPVAELDRGRADDDLLALELLQGGGIAAQHVHIGDRRQRFRPDAEIDPQRLFVALVLARQQRADRRQKFAVQQSRRTNSAAPARPARPRH